MPDNDSTKMPISRAELLYSRHDLRSDRDLCNTSHLNLNLQQPFLHSAFEPFLSLGLQIHNHCHLAQHIAQRRLHNDEANAFALAASTRWHTVAASAIAGQIAGCSFAGVRTWYIWRHPLWYPAAAPGLRFRGSSLLNPASGLRAWVRVLACGNYGMAVAAFLATSYATFRARATLDRDPRLSKWRKDVDRCIYKHLAALIPQGRATKAYFCFGRRLVLRADGQTYPSEGI